MSRNIREMVSSNIEAAIDLYAPGELSVGWDITYMMVQTSPTSGPVLQGFLIMTMPNPVLGYPALSSFCPIDAVKLVDQDRANEAVLANVTALRELKARMLAPTNGGPAGGFIIPE